MYLKNKKSAISIWKDGHKELLSLKEFHKNLKVNKVMIDGIRKNNWNQLRMKVSYLWLIMIKPLKHLV